MGRPREVPVRLRVRVERCANLPKLSKGPGGCDPFVVMEVLNTEHTILIGGDRELNCDGCRTKPLRRVLEGYFEEDFTFKVNTNMVRERCVLQLRLMDAKPPPQPAAGVGFVQVPLHELASRGGAREAAVCNLFTLGLVTNTYGTRFEHGSELRGYRDPMAPSTLEFSVELLPPALTPNATVPAEQQMTPWDFFLMEPVEQDAYDEKLVALEAMLLAQQAAEAERVRLKRLKEKKEAHERLMAKKLKDPLTWRTNWKELQENLKNDLFRREWGPGMDKLRGFGGWRRKNGNGVQEERQEDAERMLVQQLMKYERMEREEDAEVARYVQQRNARRLREMTQHLFEWSDAGGIYTAELNPGQRSLAASISKCMPTARLPADRVGSRALTRSADAASAPFQWLAGKVAGGRPVNFLAPNAAARPGGGEGEAGAGPEVVWEVGFAELKEAVLREVLGGDSESPWRQDVEHVLQRFVDHLHIVEVCQGEWLTQASQERLGALIAARRLQLQSAEEATREARPFMAASRPRTAMIKDADLSTLVQALEAECAALMGSKPGAGAREELIAWGGVYAEKSKQLDMARRLQERDHAARNAARQSKAPSSPLVRVGSPLAKLSRGASSRAASASAAAARAEDGGGGEAVGTGANVLILADDGEEAGSHTSRSRPNTDSRPATQGSRPRTRASDSRASRPATSAALHPTTIEELHDHDVPVQSRLSKVSRSSTPTAVQTARGLEMRPSLPDAGATPTWEAFHSNQQDFLFPAIAPGRASPAGRISRPSTQQMTYRSAAADTNRSEYAQSIQTDSVLPPLRNLFAGEEHHSYVPPAADRWEYTDKMASGQTYRELELLPELRRLGTGGKIKIAETTENPRPDSSATLVRVPPERLGATVTIAAIRPGGPLTHLEGRYAAWGKHCEFSGQVVNLPPLVAPDSEFAAHHSLAGKVALFNVPAKAKCQGNDVACLSAAKAALAKCAAAIFIGSDDAFVISEGGPTDLQIPVLLLRRTDGMELYNWINPPVNFNPADITVRLWKPPWFADGASKSNWNDNVLDAAADGADGVDGVDAEKALVEFWRRCLTETEIGQEWVEETRSVVYQALNIPWEHTLPTRDGGSPYRPRKGKGLGQERAQAAAEAEAEAEGQAMSKGAGADEGAGEGDGGGDGGGDGDVFSRAFARVPSFVRRTSSAGFDLKKGTILRMAQTARGIVRISKPLAVLICNAQNMMRASNGASRDLPGYAADMRRLEAMLPTLGFRLLPTYWNKNADEVRKLLRHVQRGFQKGGALSFHDSLLIVLTGHCDGQNVECSMDSSGQTGAIGLSMLLSYFTDANAPGLQGKLKLFVFGLALGHPVNMPSHTTAATASSSSAVSTLPPPSNAGATEEAKGGAEDADDGRGGRGSINVLNSVSTGGRARVYASQGLKRAELQVRPERQQDEEALLRSEGDELRDHVTLSYKQEPWTGTWWSKNNFSSTGALIIDLGRVVRDIDTFAVFQMATSEAKATSMIVQRAPETYDHSDTPPQKLEWIDVSDDRGNFELPLIQVDTSLGGGGGSIQQASRVLKVPKFSTRWMRLELSNDGTYGCLNGVGLRQLKAFCSPVWEPVPAHSEDAATWTEDPSAGAGGPALNRVGADSVHPVYQMPDVAFTGQAKSMDGMIGLSSDYSLMSYSVPKNGVSEIPATGSALLNSLMQILESAHHKHTLQDMLGTALQDLVDKDCTGRCTPGYTEVVRLLQRRCDEDDFPLMFDMGPDRDLSFGIPGPYIRNTDMGAPYEYRVYGMDVPEPRNIVRDQAVAERLKARASMKPRQLKITFHQHLRSLSFALSHANVTLTKSSKTPHCVAACTLQIPTGIKRLRWDLHIGSLEVLGGDALAVPELRVGVVRQNFCRDIDFDNYRLGEDQNSWAIQTASVSLYKVHAGQATPASGIRFNKGDVVTMQLDLDRQTLVYTINEVEFVTPFTNVRGPVVPAISTDQKTVCRLTLDKCQHW